MKKQKHDEIDEWIDLLIEMGAITPHGDDYIINHDKIEELLRKIAIERANRMGVV